MTVPAAEDRWPELPGALGQVAEAAGLDAALALAEAHGGTTIHIPEIPRRNSVLVKAIGPRAADAVIRALGPGRLLVPLGPTGGWRRTRRTIGRLLDAGHSHQAIARQVGCHVRTVERCAAERRGDARQGSLFDEDIAREG